MNQNRLSTVGTILIITLVMVLSIITIAAPANAQTSSADRTVGSSSISTADSTTVTVTVQTDSSGSGFVIDDTFSGDIDSASSNIVDDAGGNIINNVIDSSGTIITIDNPDPNSQFVVEYTINSVDNATLSGSSGSITIMDGASSSVFMGSDTIAVNAPTGNVPGPGDVTGNGSPAEDPDSDGLYEDVNGDGVTDLLDVAAFKSYLNTTQSNQSPGFDFNGDGQVGLIDVQPLRNEVAPGSGGSGGSTGPGDVTGNGNPATDPDGDGLYEDVNGDGSTNLIDVQSFKNILNTSQTVSSAFDFNGDTTVNLQDVQPLRNEVAPGSGGSGGSTGPGDVTGNGQAATDPDGDGLYEDVNGDGATDLSDVQALESYINNGGTALGFDFNNDGTVNLLDKTALDSQIGAGSGGSGSSQGQTVTLTPRTQSVSAGGSTTYDLVVTGVNNGVGVYTIDVGTSDVAAATITGASIPSAIQQPTSTTQTSVSQSNDKVTLGPNFGLDSADTGNVTIATVEIKGQTPGTSADIEVTNIATLGDESGTAISVSSIANSSVQVTAGPGDVTGNGKAAKDPDSNGKYEDINGNGQVDLLDVQVLFANLNQFKGNPAFDINDNGSVNLLDVQALFSNI